LQGARAGSAYSAIGLRNHEAVSGYIRAYDDLDGDEQPVLRQLEKTKKKKQKEKMVG